MDSTKKRERATNFNQNEVRVLTELVTKYRGIIENKKTDAVTNKDKEAAWNKIASVFNATTGGTPRNSKNLKLKYESIKKETKKSMAKHRQELYRTGGGPSSGADLTEVQEKVLAICSNITGLDARNDSDSIPAPPVATKAENDEKLPDQLLDELIIIVPSNDTPMSSGDNDISDGQILKGDSAVRCTENVLDQGALDADQPKQDDIIHTDNANNWSSWKPKSLKTKINPILRNPTKAGVTATLDKLTKARLELVELQREHTLKEHAFVEEEHKLKMLHLQNDEKRKQELHDILVRQLNNKDNYQTTYNVLNNMKM